MNPDSPLLQQLQQQLARLDTQQLRRTRRTTESPCAPQLQVDGKALLAFCSNDYLGLASHPRIVESIREGALMYGAGSGASHLISGHSRAHALLEERLAGLFDANLVDARALYFSTGYMANLAVLTAMADKDTAIFSEALNHASLIDGVKLSRAQVTIYPHQDLHQLEAMLTASQAAKKLVVTDSVFSMDGEIAPLPALLALCERYGAWLVVDDAHGFGVLGEQGHGVLEHFALRSPNLIYMGTLGKAAGVSGAFVAAHASVIEWLVQRGRTYIYTTAAAPALAHALLTSIDIITGCEGAALRLHLRQLIMQWRAAIHTRHWKLLPSTTAIQPIVIGGNQATLDAAAALREQGMWVAAIRPPTVPADTARLRITLSAAHTGEQIVQIAATINQLDS
jgi:8-amino-7-oxononanoate synthase